VRGKAVRAAAEAVLDPAGERVACLTEDPGRGLGRSECPRQLEQREWVPVCLGEEAFTNRRVEMADERRVEQRARIGELQPIELEFGNALELVTASRAAKSSPTESAPRRARRMPVRASSQDRATEHRRRHRGALGCRRLGHEAERRKSHQVAVRRLSGVRPKATLRASRCGSGSASIVSSIGRQSC
jgi:hypothetical protein